MKIKSLKISTFDLLIGIFLLAVGFVFLLFFQRKTEYVNMTVKVTDQDVLFGYSRPNSFYTDHFVVGDVELDNLGRVISEITNVESFQIGQNNNIVYVTLKVRATYDTRTKQYFSRGQKLLYGAPIRFSLSKVTFDGYVVDFPGKDTSSEVLKKVVRVVVRAREVEKELADSILVSDSVLTSYGEPIMEVTEKQVVPADMVTVDSQGIVALRKSPLHKDIYLTLIIHATKIGQTYYLFDDIPLVVGSFNNFVINNNLIEGANILSVEEI